MLVKNDDRVERCVNVAYVKTLNATVPVSPVSTQDNFPTDIQYCRNGKESFLCHHDISFALVRSYT